jgi:hypothetical protein
MYIPKDPTQLKRAKKSKYRNVKTKAQGRKYDSVGERERAFFLQEAQRQGKICNLEYQVKYCLKVNGIEICNYIADFVYEKVYDKNKLKRAGTYVIQAPDLLIVGDTSIVEDFKGGYRLPPDWPIKQKLMKACHGIDVKIVKEPTAALG